MTEVIIEKLKKTAIIENVNYFSLEIDKIYLKFKTSPDIGLTQKQSEEMLEIYGPNELKKVKKSFIKVILAPIINLLIIIYLSSAFLMWILGEVGRTLPTFIIVGINALVAIIQQFRAEKQLEALKKLSEATAIVLRDGKEMELPTAKVVAGDIVKFSQGDKIPADCRIIESRNLSIDEASLTGESEPVKKMNSSKLIEGDNIPLQDQKNMLFMGTFVSSGEGTAVVAKVGSQTEIGKISTKLEETSTGEIPLRNKMNTVGKYLGIGVLMLLVLSIIWKSVVMKSLGILEWDTFRLALIDSIDLGMKVMPINLPLLTTIVLLTGVIAMAAKGVIVREISRTESLGRVSIVCSDKTGTLTQNQMTVIKIWTTSKEYEVNGLGYEPKGIIHFPWNAVTAVKNDDLNLLIHSGYLNNNSILQKEEHKILGRGKHKTNWSILGLPTEASLKVLGKKYDKEIDNITNKYEFVHEFNFDSSIKRMSKIFRVKLKEKTVLFSKGATEWILPLCSNYKIDGKIEQLTDEIRDNIKSNMQKYAGKGYRILSITYRELKESDLPKNLNNDNARNQCEQDLTYLGFVVILDPPREDVFQAIEEAKSAGVSTIMITGDSLITGKAIATQLGIYNEEFDLVVEGNQLSELPDDEFKRVKVFARVSPEHKLTIVDKYQKMGKIVSMTGDGVNDALALSMADCGLAMGIQGTEVAKEAADMIITDDSFSTIITGIKEGRGLFMKIRTILYFFACVSVMEAIILFASTLNINDPYFAMWDYWQLNLLYVTAHMFPSLGFTFGNNSSTIMEEKPRDSAEILTWPIFKIMVIQMFLIGSAILLSYYLCYFEIIRLNSVNSTVGYNAAVTVPASQIKARTMAMLVLFILESVFLPLQIRRINIPLKESLKDIDYFKEFLFYLSAMLILIVVIYSLKIQEFMGKTIGWNLNFMYLSFWDWIICLALCAPAVVGFELIRNYYRKKKVVF